MTGIIDKNGDILLLTETEFEKGYIQQFNGCMYSAFVKCGNTPADVIGLKLRKIPSHTKKPPRNSLLKGGK